MLTRKQYNNILMGSLLIGCAAVISPITAPPATTFLLAFGGSALVLSMLTNMKNAFSSYNSSGTVFRSFGIQWPSYRSRLRVFRPEHRPAPDVHYNVRVRHGGEPHLRRTTAAGTPIPSDARNVTRHVEVTEPSSRSSVSSRETAAGTRIPSDARNVRRHVEVKEPSPRGGSTPTETAAGTRIPSGARNVRRTVTGGGSSTTHHDHSSTRTRKHGESYMGPNVVVRDRPAPVVISSTSRSQSASTTTPTSTSNHSYLSTKRVVRHRG